MGAVAALCYRHGLRAACLDLTQGRGVDVVLDVVGGDYVRRNLQALASAGAVSLSFLQEYGPLRPAGADAKSN